MATKTNRKPAQLTEDALLLIERGYGIVPQGDETAIREALRNCEMQRREMGIEPKSADAEKRTIRTTIATEAPTRMWDYERWEAVDEVLLMSGCRLAEVRGGKLPLLDCHMRDTARNVLGSVVDLKIEGDKLAGTEVFSSLAAPEFQKSAEGHLDQRSVGYRVFAATYINPGESATVNGKQFSAPANRTLKIATDWLPMEESVVPIGADPSSGIRKMQTAPQPKEEKNMDPKIREMLVSKGMSPNASDEEALRFLAELDKRAPQPAPAVPQPDKSGEEAKREIERRDSLTNAFRAYMDREGVRELHDKAVADKLDLAAAQRALIDHLAKGQQSLGVRVAKTEDENMRQNLEAAIVVRASGIVQKDGSAVKIDDETRKRAQEFAGLDLVDGARECLVRRGENVRGMGRMELVGRAFTHSSGDFPYTLANVAKKVLLSSFATAPGVWREIAAIGSLSDFKTAYANKMSEAGIMAEVQEGAEFPEHTYTEGREAMTLKTYGQIFSITRQAIINDDLGAFTRVPASHARAWARTINQLVLKVFMANPTLTDSVALFNSAHGNLDGSLAAVTSVDTAAAVVRSFRKLLLQQKDLDAKSYLNIPLRTLLVPPSIEAYFVQAVYETGKADNNSGVDIQRLGLRVLCDGELENTALTNYSAAASYGFADPMDAPAVMASFLDGNEAPRMEQETGFTVDGVKFKVAGDVAASVVDHRGILKHLNGAS